MNNAKIEKIAYKSYCEEFELNPKWLGKTFEYKGRTYTITGLNIRSKTFPVVTKEHARFAADTVRGLMTGTMAAIEKQRLRDFKNKSEAQLKEARKDYPEYAIGYGLKPEWLDKTFVDRNKTYRIDGLKLSSRTYAVVTRLEDGTPYFFNTEHVIRLMKAHS